MRVHPATGPQDACLSAAEAYEAIAATYDDQQRGDEWMRRRLHAHYLSVFGTGQHVLDIGCGTGTDALVLAQHGIRVLGLDGAPAMIAELHRKVGATGLRNRIEGRILALDDLARLEGAFDGAYSSFASLSTVELEPFAAQAARLLRPRARMVLHLLNRFSVWEWLGQRRWPPVAHPVRTFSIGGQAVPHRLYFARDAYARYFARAFALRGAYGLGALRPPHTVRRAPRRLVSGLEWLDVRVGGLPGVLNAGRFFVLDLERRA
jgi:SAM-dependent methyltransferase